MTTNFYLVPEDQWKRRENCILLDVTTLDFKIHKRTRGRLRLYLGAFDEGEFKITIPTIKALNAEAERNIRGMTEFIIMSVIERPKPKFKRNENAKKKEPQYQFHKKVIARKPAKERESRPLCRYIEYV
jgi:hypothetical protein